MNDVIDRPESSGIASSADDVLTYNYEHFWLKHFVADLLRTSHGAGLRPVSRAPGFDLSPPKAPISGWPIPEADRCCSTSAARPDRSPSAQSPVKSRLSDGLLELVHHRVGHRLHVVHVRRVLGDLGSQLFSGVCLGLPTAGVAGVLSAVMERHSAPFGAVGMSTPRAVLY